MSDHDHSSDAEVATTAPTVGTRAVVLRGGVPSDDQAAALAAALLSIEEAAASTSPQLSGWQRAALAEGVGARQYAERYDLDGPVVG